MLNLARRLRGQRILLHRIALNHLNQSSRDGTTALSNGCETPSTDSAPRLNKMVIRLRQHTDVRIINGWMVLIVILGAVIAVADGLTRAPNLEMELSPPQSLQYEPYRAAFLLAGVTLPLMLAYARKARVSLTEGLFLWFLFCTTAYMKDFSYLPLPGTPLFVTDVVLIVFLLWAVILRVRSHVRIPLRLNILLTLFFAAGMLSAARGFLGHHDSILVLRDSALIAYALFLPAGYHLTRTWLTIRRVPLWFALGATLSVLNGLAWFIVAPEQRRFISPGIYILISLVGVLIMMANRLIRPRVGWIFMGVFFLGLLVANARSLLVSLLVVVLVVLFIPGILRNKLRSACLAATLVTAAVLACSFALPSVPLYAGRDFAARVANNLSSGFLHTSDDQYWQFRLAAWKEAWRRFEQYPPAGEGLGTRFVFGIWDNDPRPHNTFLTVLYKMGLVGFLPFLALIVYFFWIVIRAGHRNRQSLRTSWLWIVVLAQVAFCTYGGANLLLESPFLASLFWAGIGFGLRTAQMLDLGNPVIRRAYGN